MEAKKYTVIKLKHIDRGMKYGIIHKDFKRAEEYVVRKAKKISEEYM